MPFYKINAGVASVHNGAKFPLTVLLQLADSMDQKVIPDRSYGEDFLPVPEDSTKRQAVEEILEEEKLIWEIVPELPGHLKDLVRLDCGSPQNA